MPIQFFFVDTTISLTERKRLKLFIEGIFHQNKRKLNSLSFIFCTDNYLLDINKQFLEHDYFTDIITFNLSDDAKTIEGEIYISVDRVKENAITNKELLRLELHRIIFHGVLHLCGYKDKKPTDKKKMTKAENDYLHQYFY